MNHNDSSVTAGLKPALVSVDAVRQELPFQDLFKIQPAVLDSITADMRVNGFDPAFPMLIWNGVILDGHTRHVAAQNVGINQVWTVNYDLASVEEALQVAIYSQLDRRRKLTDSDIYRLVVALDRELPPKSGTTDEKGESVPDKTAALIGTYGSKVAAVRYIAAHETEDIRQQLENGEFSINHAAKACREAAGETKKRKVSDTPHYGKIIKLLESAVKLSKTDESAKDLAVLKTGFEVKRTAQAAAKLAAKAAKKAAREAAKAAKKRGQVATSKPVIKNCGKHVA